MKWLVYGARPLYTAELADIIERRGDTFVGGIDNLPPAQDSLPGDRVWLTPSHLSQGLVDFDALVLSAGPPGIRKLLREELSDQDMTCFELLIDLSSTVARTATIASGVTINAHVVVGAQATIDEFVQINRSASVGHHTLLNPFVTIGPGVTVASSVTIGPGAFVGAGATILPGVSIGENATVGAGSVITQDVPAFAVVVGNPAKILRIADTGYGGFIV